MSRQLMRFRKMIMLAKRKKASYNVLTNNKSNEDGGTVMWTLFILLLLAYTYYRAVKPRYEKQYKETLRFRDIFNKKYWDKI